MDNFRKSFFQLLLIILAVAFTLCIRYLTQTQSTQAGAFGADVECAITVSDIFKEPLAERRQK